MIRRMRGFAGLSLVLVAGCLDQNPIFVEPPATTGDTQGGESTAAPLTTDMMPTSTPPTTMPPPPTTGESAEGSGATTESPDTDSSATMSGFCGDGVIGPNEECDDANDDDADECLNSCKLAYCGDGVLRLGKEECDDGNPEDADDCLSTCVVPTCGDMVVWEGHEECDDGNTVKTDACIDCFKAVCGDQFVQEGVEDCDEPDAEMNDGCEPGICKQSVRLVFVTSVPYTGGFGGIGLANLKCEALAMMAGLPKSGYMAWLSDNNVWPAKVMDQADFPYVKVNGEKVADNWNELVSGKLQSPINLTEKGLPPPVLADPPPCPGYKVHTNTNPMGQPAGVDSCGGWMVGGGPALGGSTDNSDMGWTALCGSDQACAYKAPIYCIQQK